MKALEAKNNEIPKDGDRPSDEQNAMYTQGHSLADIEQLTK